jgi:hypothetical protein
MRTKWKIILIASASFLLLIGFVVAKEFDYSFMPKGGSELLLNVLTKCKTCDLKYIIANKMTKEKWKEYLQGKGGLAGLNPKQVDTPHPLPGDQYAGSESQNSQRHYENENLGPAG